MGHRIASALRAAYRRIARSGFLAVLLILLAVALPAPIRTALQAAGPIIVNTTSDEENPGDGHCSLREAISNANSPGSDTTGGDCVVGTGNDTITFSVSGTIRLVGSGLPAIANALTIDGTGQAITLDGAGSFGVLAVILGATLNVKSLTIAHGFNDAGGGAITAGGTVTVTNSIFAANSAADGGAIFSLGGTVVVSNSTFSGNSTTTDGGGIASNGTLTVTNSTFSGNSASEGGGIFNVAGGIVTVTNCTFSGNSASKTGGGGGIFNEQGTVTVTNSVLAASKSGGNCATEAASTIVNNGGDNISDDATCGFGTSTGANGQTIGDNVDPLLDSNGLQNDGAPTQTIALQSNSPAIDAIPIAQCPATDQRGFARPDPEDGGGANPACDIGAFESGPIATRATLNVSPNPLSFGRHRRGSRATKSVKVQAPRSNRVTVVLESFSVSSASGDYSLNSGKTTCTQGESLSPRSSCAIGIDFIPSAKTKGQTDVGQLQVQTNAEVIKPKSGLVTLEGGGK
jgi:CSLREA domain-containing protein